MIRVTSGTRRLATGMLLVAATVTTAVVTADENIRYNQVRFQAHSSEQVQNDRIQAVLSVYGEDKNPASLANYINSTMDWALNTAGAYENVQTSTGLYQTYPVHQKGVLKRWRANQQLTLTAGDFGEVVRLVGELQSRLQVKSMDFSLFPQTRAVVEDQLIFAALDKFKERAELVRQNLGAGGYRIVDLSINTGGGGSRPVPLMRAQMAMETVTPPAVEGGDSTITVTVSGVIEVE